jgi:hypothetical protein
MIEQIQKVRAAFYKCFLRPAITLSVQDSGDCVECAVRDSGVTDAEWTELEKAKKLREEVNCFIMCLQRTRSTLLAPSEKEVFAFL